MDGRRNFLPRVLELTEKQKIEGYLANNWAMQDNLPDYHPYKSTFPKGAPALCQWHARKMGIYEVSVTATNQWGHTTGTFDVEVLATPPQSQTADATQIGSTSARLQANVLDLGGMDGNLSFIWSRDANLSVSAETYFTGYHDRLFLSLAHQLLQRLITTKLN